ncbi:filaggrin-2-like [Pecten maximus]|uniref:filaggrin-2-like n=1 Tax=Pecten maximus TaxID=6579 RepID=UPI0014580D5E|nr:filaggrin-2-like [Pecten maximus]
MVVPGEKFVRVNYRHYHSWLIPRSAVCGLLSCALISMLIGIILLQFGSILIPWGAVVFVVGVLCLCVCICLCLHAYCIFQLKDQETQTEDETIIISSKDSELSPNFTVLDKKPPPGPDSGVRNGRYGGGGGSLAKKQVSISPGVSIPIQHHGPQQVQVSYVQANRAYPQSGTYTTTGGQPNQSPGQQMSVPHAQGSAGYGSTNTGGHMTGGSANHIGSKQVSTGADQSHGGVTGSNISGNYSGSGGHVTGNYPPHSTGPHVNIGYSQYGGSGQLSPGGYHGSRSGTMSSVSSRGHSPGYGYPLQPHQPTPYSTLTQKSVTPVSMSHVQHGHVVKQTGGYDEDYDNTAETAPMIGQSQNQSNQSWRPSGLSRDDDVPEPQPLVYPSERRPMTFEQTSTSKMSIYDNMYSLDKLDE